MTSEEMVVKVAEVEHRAKSNTRRIDKLEQQTEAIQSLATSVEILVKEQGHQSAAMDRIEKNVEKLDGKVEALEKKPVKKWDKAIEIIVSLLIGAVLALVFAKIGLS